jgi:lysophospholipase L1-like esterase
MKNILFFGDSNTWGYTPGTGERYPADVRWTSVAARALGEPYHCIECGINGRTTVYEDPWRGCRRGSDALDYELVANTPLDLLVIMLGTNDLKFADAYRSAKGVNTLLNMAETVDQRRFTLSPVFPNGIRELVISPIHIGPGEEHNDEYPLMPDGHEESLKFAGYLRAVAEAHGAAFLDAAELAEPSAIDCQHLLPEGHAALAAAVTDKIREIFI